MLPYFPFNSTYDKMGTASISGDNPLVEVDQHYTAEIRLKRKLLEEDHRYYYQSSPSTLVAQWEVLEKILNGLASSHPEYFTLQKDGRNVTWTNNLLGESSEFVMGDLSTLPLEPLDWIGRQVQEDLVLLDSQSVLKAGQLCFPSGWCMDEKFEKHFMAVHAPLPALMNPMIQAADKLIERIPVNRPIARTNWGFRVSDQLDLSSKHGAAYRKILQAVSSELTPENIGEKIFYRIERQTLSRLPESGHVLFTIHTYNSLLKNEVEDRSRASSTLSFLKNVPAELLEYKLITPFAKPLMAYLEAIQ